MIYNDNSCLNKKNQYYVNNIDTSINKYISYTNYNKKRIEINLPMWGMNIGEYIDKNKIDTSIELSPKEEGGKSIRHQFLKSDKSIELSTLEFEN